MTPSSAPWCHVTLYYAVWNAARGLMGYFGGGVIHNRVLEVLEGDPGNQELELREIAISDSVAIKQRGSHRRFWDVFYQSMVPLVHRVPRELRFAIEPVNGDRLWHINRRNEVNYNPASAIAASQAFDAAFDANKFPDSLPGDLHLAFTRAEAMLRLAVQYKMMFGLDDAFVPKGLRSTVAGDTSLVSGHMLDVLNEYAHA